MYWTFCRCAAHAVLLSHQATLGNPGKHPKNRLYGMFTYHFKVLNHNLRKYLFSY